MTTSECAPGRAFGLRFIVDVVNDLRTESDWQELTAKHGGGELRNLAFDEAEIMRAVTSVRALFMETRMKQAVEVINRELCALDATPELVRLTDARWALRPRLDVDSAAHTVRLLAVHSLAEWVAERGRCAWGVCEARDCVRAFVDEGRREPQRFCSSTCATRTRVATLRRRRSVKTVEASPGRE